MAPTVSTTYPAAVQEIAHIIAAAEETLSPAQNNVSIDYSQDGKTITIVATLPYTSSHSGENTIITPVNYVSTVVSDFSCASILSDGLTVNNPVAALLRVVSEANDIEETRIANGQPVPEGTGIGYTVNPDTKTVTINAVMQAQFQLVNGEVKVVATNYLA